MIFQKVYQLPWFSVKRIMTERMIAMSDKNRRKLPMALLDLALNIKDKEWYERLMSEEFSKEMGFGTQEFETKMDELQCQYREAQSVNDYNYMIDLAIQSDALRVAHGFEKRSDSLIENLRYVRDAIAVQKTYGIPGKPVVFDVALKEWKDGKAVYFYISREDGQIGKLKSYRILHEAEEVEKEMQKYNTVYKCLWYANGDDFSWNPR